MTRGDRVSTPLGPGTVAYVRYDHLAPADAPMPLAAVSVVLDARRERLGYTGTIFSAELIRPLPAGASMTYDPTENARRALREELNASPETPDGPTWTTDELTRDFDVLGFLAPFVHVRRKADGVTGTLMFRHSPRVYFGWEPTA